MSFERDRRRPESQGEERYGRPGRSGGRSGGEFEDDREGGRAYSEGGRAESPRGFEGRFEEERYGSRGFEQGERSWRQGEERERFPGFEHDTSSGSFGRETSGHGRPSGRRMGSGSSEEFGGVRYRGGREASGGRREPWSGEDFGGGRGQYAGSFGYGTARFREQADGYDESPGRSWQSPGRSYGSSEIGGGSYGEGFGTRGGAESFGRRDASSVGYGSGYGSSASRQGVEPGRFSGKGPKGYRRSDDRIKEDVSDLLERHGDLDASEIEVSVQSGEVTLEGAVSDRRSKRLAEDLIEDLPGVRQVHNRLRVSASNDREEIPSSSSSGAKGVTRPGSSGSTGRTSSTT